MPSEDFALGVGVNLVLRGSSGSVSLSGGAATSDHTLTLPATAAGSDKILFDDGGSGTLNWLNPGVGIAISGTYLTVDLSELTDMTATMVGSDEFIVLDNGGDRRKAASEIGLSIFNNDANFLTNISIGTSVSSGTTGSILFVDSSTQVGQDNTNLFWDDSNNRLGLGTNSPTYTLEVESADNILARFKSTDANASIQLLDNGTTNATAFTRTSNNMNILPNGGKLGLPEINSYASSAPTDGQLLIGDTASGVFDAATLTGGTGITVTNGAGAVTLSTDLTEVMANNSTANAVLTSDGDGTLTAETNVLYSTTNGLEIKDEAYSYGTNIVSLGTNTSLTRTTHSGRYIRCTAGITLTLPGSATVGEHYTIINDSTGTVTINVANALSETINGGSSVSITSRYKAISVIAFTSTPDWVGLGA
jgi:hypothetical protein